MNKRLPLLRYALIFALLGPTCASFNRCAPAQTTPTSAAPQANPALKASAPKAPAPGVLDRDQASAVMPTSVFYKGQSAPTQGRNSAGIRFPGGKLALMALVDTSGYSSAVQQSYQGYLLTEVSLRIGDKTLRPGAYGFGFIAGNRAVVMDIGGNELLHATTTRDEQMRRPNPLQILPEASMPGSYRLYLGRSYVVLSAAK